MEDRTLNRAASWMMGHAHANAACAPRTRRARGTDALSGSPRRHDCNLWTICNGLALHQGSYASTMATFLLKTEPGTYSYTDLVREKKTAWSGVANAAALIHLRSTRPGDECFIYHTGDERAIVGLARVASKPYADPAQPGTTPTGEPKFAVIDLTPVKPAKTPLTLAAMKADAKFKEFALLKQSRLSVMPVPAPIEKLIRSMAGL